MRHPILSGLALLLALLAAFAAYYHPRIPAWLERQAESILSVHGVRDVELGSLHFSSEQLSTDYLRLRGEVDGLSFDISATDLVVGYEPRALLQGEIKTLAVARLTLSLTEMASPVADGERSVALSEFSPYTILSALPLATAKVQQWQLQYQPQRGAPVDAHGQFSWDQGLAGSYQAVFQDLRFAGKVRASSSDALQLDVQANADDGARLGAIRADLQRAAANSWRWTLEGDVVYAPLLERLRTLAREHQVFADPLALDALVLAGEGQFEGRLEHADTISYSGQALFEQFQGGLQLRSVITELSQRGLLQAGSGNAVVRAELAGDALALTLGAAEFEGEVLVSALELPEETRSWLRWGQTVPLRWRNPGEASLNLDTSGAMSFSLENNRVLLGDQQSQLRWDAIRLIASRDAQSPSVLNAALEGRLDARLRQQQMPQLQLVLSTQDTGQRNDFDLQLVDTAQSLRLAVDGSLDPQTGQGSYHAQLQSLDLAYASSVLLPLLQKFDVLQQVPILESGAFMLVSDVRSASFAMDDLTQQSALKIEEVSGAYDEYQFEGVSVDANWSGLTQWQTRGPADLAIDRLDVGFEITDTKAQLSLPKPTSPNRPVVRIDAFESGMFGGSVSLPEPQFWDIGSSSNSITLRAEDWRLADMVALQRGYDIDAQGVLEGELPVTVADGRIIIEKGYLRAREPGGTIRFKADAASQALLANSSELALAMGLLEDFRYRTLSSEVELDPLGNLLLALSLEGSNPAKYEGRPIRFNINLEQNLDPLLQSLRLSDRLVNKVEKGLR